MKNKLTDLNDHLFAQLERLGDETLSSDQLKAEIDRTKAMSSLAKEVVSSASLELQARKFVAGDGIVTDKNLPTIMQSKTKLVSCQS